MAEGGYWHPTDDDFEIGSELVKNRLKGDDDKDDLSATQPFQPGGASTPYHRGE